MKKLELIKQKIEKQYNLIKDSRNPLLEEKQENLCYDLECINHVISILNEEIRESDKLFCHLHEYCRYTDDDQNCTRLDLRCAHRQNN